MKTEVEFRGLRKDGEGFVYGDRVQGASGKVYIFDYDDIIGNSHIHEVIPESVGQFTGLKDKKGVKIFEGDILKRVISFSGSNNEFIEKVIFEGACFCTISLTDKEDSPLFLCGDYIGHSIYVIENIHEKHD